MSFEPVRCTYELNGYGKPFVHFTDHAHPTRPVAQDIERHDAVVIPIAHAEAVERVVRAKKALDSLCDVSDEAEDDSKAALDAALAALLTIWRPTP